MTGSLVHEAIRDEPPDFVPPFRVVDQLGALGVGSIPANLEILALVIWVIEEVEHVEDEEPYFAQGDDRNDPSRGPTFVLLRPGNLPHHAFDGLSEGRILSMI